MSDIPIIDAYERVLIQDAKSNYVFLYALHYAETNHIQIGFGMESRSELQKAHLPGANLHQAHTLYVAQWMRDGGSIVFTDAKPPRVHPFTSALDSTGQQNYGLMLANTEELVLTAGRFMPLLADQRAWPLTVEHFAEALTRVHYTAFGNPLDWDVKRVDLSDGRFVWMAFDSDIDKIRCGLGYYNADNDPMYGVHTYAVSRRELAAFVAFHFYYLDAPLQFLGLPPRWPDKLSYFVTGKGKQRFAGELLKLADLIWPGQATSE